LFNIFCIIGLDGNTSAQERERLINRFNSPDNTDVLLFMLSTRFALLAQFPLNTAIQKLTSNYLELFPFLEQFSIPLNVQDRGYSLVIWAWWDH